MPPRKRNGAKPREDGAAQVEQASEQPTASAGASGKFRVRVVGGWPRQVESVFAIYPHGHVARDMADRLSRSGAHAFWEPAEPGDYPGRILGGAKP